MDTIPRRFFAWGTTKPNATAYAVKRDGAWQATTWQAYAAEVRQVAKALLALGLQPGDRTAIRGSNRPEWATFDLATMAVGGAAAGIYVTSSPRQARYVLDHSGAAIALVEGRDGWERVAEVLDELPRLRHVVLMAGAERPDHPKALSWEQFLEAGANVPDRAVEEHLDALRGDDLGMLVYTSGTTGPPKGVMLPHAALTAIADTANVWLRDDGPDDCLLSYLPMAHIVERGFTVLGPASRGYAVSYNTALEHLVEDLREVRPSLFMGVPRVWEKMQAALQMRIDAARGTKAGLVRWTMRVGRAAMEYRNRGQEPPAWLAAQHRLADRLVYQKVKAALGLDRCRTLISGAAPIDPEVLRFFAGFDLLICEAYGMSENGGITTRNAPGATRYGTVGRPYDGVQVRRAPDGELLMRGPTLFSGYYRNPEATTETLRDGWLHTGDLAMIDDDGFVTITGRKKELLITAGGKNVAPGPIEELLKGHPLVADAMVVGDRRKYLAALLVLDVEAAQAWAKRKRVSAADLHEHPRLLEALQRHIDHINGELAHTEQVKRFAVLPQPFTVEHGELTPTMKLRRGIIAERHAAVIERLYANAPSATYSAPDL